MKIAIIFDGPSALGGASPDLLIVETVDAVERACATDGHKVDRIPVNLDGRWFERVRRGKYDVVFNLCEGVDGVAQLEPAVIAALELLGVPHTGSSAWTTALCLRKHLVNEVLHQAGLPVPRFGLVRPGDPLPTVGFPAICKPAMEDASLGVEQRSVVRSMRALTARVAAMHHRWQDVLVQRFVDGREVNVGILGDQALPVAEIDFGSMPAGLWRIVSYRSKWEEGSDEDLGAVPRCPAELSDALTEELTTIALAAWRLVGGDGYGRVDFRVDRRGRPWILEVNANPDLSPHAGLARMARVAGFDYQALVRAVCASAVSHDRHSADVCWTLAQQLSGVAPAAPARATQAANGTPLAAVGHR